MNLEQLKQSAQHFGLSHLSKKTGLARSFLYRVFEGSSSPTIESLEKIVSALGFEFEIRQKPLSNSVEEVTSLVAADGEWKIHYFNFVDAFRKTRNPELVKVAPNAALSPQLFALISSITGQLCYELSVETPVWARKRYYLPEPWFVSGMQSLKAMAIAESPVFFRANNIFVLENFLSRA